MSSRLSNLFPLRARTRRSLRHVATCEACGRALLADEHAIQLVGGTFHAGCVLYRRRGAPTAPRSRPPERVEAAR